MCSKRFIVKGHWRKTPDGRNIWVDQHVKGPADAPLVVSETTVCKGITVEDLPDENFLMEGHWRTDKDGTIHWVEPGVRNPRQHAEDIARFMEEQNEDDDE